MFESMMAEILGNTTDKDGGELPDEHAPAPREIFCFNAMFGEETEQPDHPLLAFGASNDPDTLYLHEATREPDADKFRDAMVKEIVGQWDNNNFRAVERSKLKRNTLILPGVWALKRKRRVVTGEVYKHKARWNLDGSKQVFGRDYEETYSHVAQWPVIRLMLVNALIQKWHAKQLDFVQAFPQAPIAKTQFVELPKGITIQGISSKTHVFEVLRNIYGGKDAGRQWFLHLKKHLLDIGFTQSQHDKCLFYCGTVIFILYTDDSIILGPDEAEIDNLIDKMKQAGLDLTVAGKLEDFLGVNIKEKQGEQGPEFHLTQPRLIESILQDLRLDGKKVKTKDTSMASSKLLGRHKKSEDFDGHFNYRRVIGKLNFLEQATHVETFLM